MMTTSVYVCFIIVNAAFFTRANPIQGFVDSYDESSYDILGRSQKAGQIMEIRNRRSVEAGSVEGTSDYNIVREGNESSEKAKVPDEPIKSSSPILHVKSEDEVRSLSPQAAPLESKSGANDLFQMMDFVSAIRAVFHSGDNNKTERVLL